MNSSLKDEVKDDDTYTEVCTCVHTHVHTQSPDTYIEGDEKLSA